MTAGVVSIVLANVAYALFGVGLAAALGAFDRRPQTFPNAAVGAALGIGAVLLLSSYGVLAGAGLGPTGLAVLVAAACAAGAWRLRSARSAPTPEPSRVTAVERALAVAPALAIAFVCVAAARAMAVKPLLEWDGWVLWATKAKILYGRPEDGAAVLREAFYGAPSYPLGLPSLQATTMRAVGEFDGALLDLQLLALCAAALLGVWALLRPVAHPIVIGLALLAPLASPQLAAQLTTNYADVPLGFLVALGVVSGAAWLAAGETRQPWQLVGFSVFLAAAAWTKNEGLVFGAAGVAALIAATLLSRTGVRAALLAGAGFVLLVLPWRLYAAANDLRTYDYDLTNFLNVPYLYDRADRVVPVTRELFQEMSATSSWGASLWVILLGIVTAVLTARRTVGVYAAVWLALSFCGLVATYWISNHPLDNNLENSSHRTVVTLLVTGLCVLPALLHPVVEDAAAAIRRRWRISRRRGAPARPEAS